MNTNQKIVELFGLPDTTIRATIEIDVEKAPTIRLEYFLDYENLEATTKKTKFKPVILDLEKEKESLSLDRLFELAARHAKSSTVCASIFTFDRAELLEFARDIEQEIRGVK